MHLFVLLFFLFHVIAAAAPTSSPTPSHSSSVSSSSHRSSSSSSSIHPHVPPHPATTPPRPPHIIPIPSKPDPTRSTPIENPVHTKEPLPPRPTTSGQSSSGQKPISIVFEVLGGLLASAVIFSFLRCYYNYRKIPRRDRIAEVLHRHHLQRELEELERNPGILRRPSLREPAPPYFPRPPSYENHDSSLSRVSSASRTGSHNPSPSPAGYSAVAVHSPPSTPPMSERIPLPSTAVNPRAHPDLPSG